MEVNQTQTSEVIPPDPNPTGPSPTGDKVPQNKIPTIQSSADKNPESVKLSTDTTDPNPTATQSPMKMNPTPDVSPSNGLGLKLIFNFSYFS